MFAANVLLKLFLLSDLIPFPLKRMKSITLLKKIVAINPNDIYSPKLREYVSDLQKSYDGLDAEEIEMLADVEEENMQLFAEKIQRDGQSNLLESNPAKAAYIPKNKQRAAGTRARTARAARTRAAGARIKRNYAAQHPEIPENIFVPFDETPNYATMPPEYAPKKKTKRSTTKRSTTQKTGAAVIVYRPNNTASQLLTRLSKMANKTVSKATLSAFLSDVQKAGLDKTVRAKSKGAALIKSAYNAVKAKAGKMKAGEKQKFTVRPATLKKINAAVTTTRKDSDENVLALSLLRQYYDKIGLAVSKSFADTWKSKAAKVPAKNKYKAKLKQAQSKISAAAGKTGKVLTIPALQLSGLQGVLGLSDDYDYSPRKGHGENYPRPKRVASLLSFAYNSVEDEENGNDDSFGDTLLQSQNSLNAGLLGLNGCECEIMPISKAGDAVLPALPLPDKWKPIFGNAPAGFAAMVVAREGQGKTTLSMRFAGDFAQHVGRVLYVSKEQYGSSTLASLIDRLGLHQQTRLDIASNIPDYNVLQKYDLLIIDSINDMRIGKNEIKQIRKHCPNLATISIVRLNQDGTYRGQTVTDIAYDSDTVIRIERGQAIATKNRNRCTQEDRIDIDYGT